MAETQYDTIVAPVPEFPPRDLVVVRSPVRKFTASLEPFGPNTFRNNIAEMQKPYSHSQTGERINFRTPTTAESIVVAVRDPAQIKQVV